MAGGLAQAKSYRVANSASRAPIGLARPSFAYRNCLVTLHMFFLKNWRLVLNFNLNFCRDVEHCMAQFTAEFSSFGESASLFHYLGVSPPSISRSPKRSHEPYQKSDSAFHCIVVVYHLHGCPNIGGKSCAVGHSSNLPFLPTVWTITPLLFAKKKMYIRICHAAQKELWLLLQMLGAVSRNLGPL
ncbi:hypothetical protein PVAP13_3NG253432 [Panicum virgatum]|uniref:Uncharacterized protein n=1 Tax=Panicum virgatum TaxID=38727 RepID=A0A8T0UGP7_PANVG|nr:hypothetical protein PVAP13_3NG253432 [Panicum virgatum]